MSYVTRGLPWALVAICALWIASLASPKVDPPNEMKLQEFGRLPLVFEGRVQPYDSLARNALRALSGRSTFDEEVVDPKTGAVTVVTRPAIRWLLDVLSHSERAPKHKIFKIVNRDVQEKLGLKPRLYSRYSIEEFRARVGDVMSDAEEAKMRSQQGFGTDAYDSQATEFANKIRLYSLLSGSHEIAEVNSLDDAKEWVNRIDFLRGFTLPHVVPPARPGDDWKPLMEAWFDEWKTQLLSKETPDADEPQPNPATRALAMMLVAYAHGDADTFNRELAAYQAHLIAHPPRELSPTRISAELLFNRVDPMLNGSMLYLAAFVLCCISWIFWRHPLANAATAVAAFTLLVHTVAIVLRIFIAGRPPVTNLHSSAVFVGWAGPAIALAVEGLIHRIASWRPLKGIGTLVACVIGFVSSLIAYYLSLEGDTFKVLQAVLDTNFWLSTHVITITMGYVATFLAGLLGIISIFSALSAGASAAHARSVLQRITYGILCFALFFSFVGTVLGGLWADDSWGRFWGWDPKENGALLIVLWNALILHARWGGVAKQRGQAALAVFGNVVTAWSWFGTNSLGIGLHSYGQAETTARWLLFFVMTQICIIMIGLLPLPGWRKRDAA